MPVPQPKRHFNIGDIVWAQARGLPSWPGQIVDENRVGKGQPDDGKVKLINYLSLNVSFDTLFYDLITLILYI